MKFDSATVLTKFSIVGYFKKGLKLFIKAEMYQDITHLNNYEELVVKALRANAKAGLRPSFYVKETDQ